MSENSAFANLAAIVRDIVSVQSILDRYHESNIRTLGVMAPSRLVAAETSISFKAEIVRERSQALTVELRPVGLSAEIRHRRRTSRTMSVTLTVVQQPLNPAPVSQPIT